MSYTRKLSGNHRLLNLNQLEYLLLLSQSDQKDNVRDPSLGRVMRSLQVRGLATLHLNGGRIADTWMITDRGRRYLAEHGLPPVAVDGQ